MRISVIGPQNTGKTTFISDFLREFDEYTTPQETYRDVVRQKNLSINQETNDESQMVIRDFLFEQAKNNKEENIIFDRCVIDNYVYTKAQCEKGKIGEAFLKETFDMMNKSLSFYDLFVLIPASVSVSLVNDNLRDIDTLFVDRINHLFLDSVLDIAKNFPANIKIISGPREERLKQIKQLIK